MKIGKKKINKNLWLRFFVIVIFFLVIFFLVSHFYRNSTTTSNNTSYVPTTNTSAEIKSVEIGGQDVKVDLALTGAEQEQGLSGRASLASNTGMLFVFDYSDKYQFWMQDMNFPIDMIWVTDNMKIDYIENDATPESYPATFGPGVNNGPAKYVLEVPAGFAKQNNLKVGDSVGFTY